MSEAEPLISSGGTDELDQYDIAEFTHRYRAALERARQHYEEYGVWPPDPLLDEVHAARREILAEHGNDWRKVIEHYIEEGETNSNSVVRIPRPEGDEPSST